MDHTQTRQYEMLVRVREFGNTNKDQFSESSLARELFGVVGAAVKELGTHAQSKMSAAKEGKSARVVAREALVAKLEAVARTARAINLDTGELGDKFQLPRPQTDQALITAAGVFASDAEGFKSRFTAHAMPKTFIADLTDLAREFEEAILDRNAGQDDHMAARTRIEDALKAGVTAARKLDAIVRNQFSDDRATLTVWLRDRKVGYPHTSKTKKGNVATASPATQSPAKQNPATPSPATTAPAAAPAASSSAATVPAAAADGIKPGA